MMLHRPLRLVLVLGLCGLAFAATPAIWLDVPFIKQEKEGCGAASIAMVMQYWRKQQSLAPDASAEMPAIQDALYSRKDHGIRASDMEHYFEQHGYKTFAFSGTWSDLQQHLEKGRPLIVALKPSALETALHYVVVAGIDEEQNVVFLNDAAQRKLLKQDRASFEKQWSAVKNWTLLTLPNTSTAQSKYH